MRCRLKPLEGRSENCHEILTAPPLQIGPYNTDHRGPRTLTELSPTPHEGRRPQETASSWRPSHSMYRNNTENHCCGLRAGSLSVGMDISKGQTSSFSKKCVCTAEHMPRSEYSLRRGAHAHLAKGALGLLIRATAPAFTWILGIRTRVLALQYVLLPPSHGPSPRNHSCLAVAFVSLDAAQC